MASIEEQVEVLMSGTEYGDPQIREEMRRALHDRLIEAEQEGRALRVYCGYDPRTADLHLGTRSRCANCANFRTLAMTSRS
ncbi:MAG: hypothetical protein SNJ59_17405 [Aggregatilineales bacterium]